MKPEDFPLVVFRGRRLRSVPELPGTGMEGWGRCTFCLACPDGKRDGNLCQKIKASGVDCSARRPGEERHLVVHVPEELFQEYVVELVRRRLSS